VTMPLPGQRLLRTNFAIDSPASTAFLARSPAQRRTPGLLALEQDAIEAIRCQSYKTFSPFVTEDAAKIS